MYLKKSKSKTKSKTQKLNRLKKTKFNKYKLFRNRRTIKRGGKDYNIVCRNDPETKEVCCRKE